MNQPIDAVWQDTGIVIVDHGSRRAESNAMLLSVVQQYQTHSPCAIIEPAHMELASPTLAQAFTRCVERGAQRVIVHPYFLLPGRHWESDIPRLAAQAAARHPRIQYLVTAPVGLHPLMAQVIQTRVQQCLDHASGSGPPCELCDGTNRCQFTP